jgi:hypothetical protein
MRKRFALFPLTGEFGMISCAFFVLLFLLSLIAHQKSRKRMLAIVVTWIAARLTTRRDA